MSTYEQRFIDVKFVGGVSGSVTVTLDEGQVFVFILSFDICIYISKILSRMNDPVKTI